MTVRSLGFGANEESQMRRFVFFPLVATFVLLAGCTPIPDTQLAENKEVVKRFIEISNDANWGQLVDVVATDFRRHSAATAGDPVKSLEEFIVLQEGFMTTFPDQHVRLDHMIAEGDHVAIRATYTGTQAGPMGDFPASGNTVNGPFIAFFRIESGKIAELWVEWDNVDMLTQLGIFPPPATSSE